MPSIKQATHNHINQFGFKKKKKKSTMKHIFCVNSLTFIFLVRARDPNLTSELKAL